MTRIGLLGGSFNPAHRAHRRISLAALEALGLDEIWWLVSPGNPLKPGKGMAPLAARFASASIMARRAAIRVTAIERELGTVYTAETLAKLAARFPQHDFIWLMGADNLGQLHRWRAWRTLSRTMPIAVATRPGYDADALKAPAWGWLRRFVRPVAMAKDWTDWRPPALVLLSSPPDPTSATAIRAANPDWHESATKSFHHRAMRDGVTRRPII